MRGCKTAKTYLIDEKIERAFGQFERGELFSAEESRANIEKRKTAWLAEQKRG